MDTPNVNGCFGAEPADDSNRPQAVTLELDMYGDKPDLALLINDIQGAVNSLH